MCHLVIVGGILFCGFDCQGDWYGDCVLFVVFYVVHEVDDPREVDEVLFLWVQLWCEEVVGL